MPVDGNHATFPLGVEDRDREWTRDVLQAIVAMASKKLSQGRGWTPLCRNSRQFRRLP